MTADNGTRMQQLGYRAPDAVPEPEQLVLVDYVSEGRIAVITINRPHALNAVTTALAAQLIEILETISARASVRVAILTSAGDEAFSVGGDLYERKSMTQEQWLRQRQVFDRVLLELRQSRRPIFSAVHGMAYGGGCEMAISTDFIIASDDAVFGQPEAMVGLSAGGGSPVFLPRVLPPGRAMQMLMTGQPIRPRRRCRLGMVNEVHPTSGAHGRRPADRGGHRDQLADGGAVGQAGGTDGPGRAGRAGGRDHDGGALALGRPCRPCRGHPCFRRGARARLRRP